MAGLPSPWPPTGLAVRVMSPPVQMFAADGVAVAEKVPCTTMCRLSLMLPQLGVWLLLAITSMS